MKANKEAFTVMRTFRTSTEAMVVKALLDAHDIDSELINETASDIFPVQASEEFQVKLLVRSEDVEKINALLDAKFNQSDLTDEFK